MVATSNKFVGDNDEALAIISQLTKGKAFSTDVHGHQHKGKGKGGGQFTKGSTHTETTAISAINNNPKLSDEQREEFSTAISQVCKNIPNKGHQLIAQGMKGGFTFYEDSFDLMSGVFNDTESQRSILGKAADVWDEFVDSMRPDHLKGTRKQARKDAIGFGAAAFVPGSGTLHLNGAGMANSPELFGKDTYEHALPHLYAHELTHAIDAKGRFSKTTEWREAWQDEIVDQGLLTEYGKTQAIEGFAEVGRAIYGGGVDLAEVERVIPRCARFFRDNGLWPV